MTDAEVKAALTPSQTVAVTIYSEARGELIEGKIGVGCVIRNRVFAGKYGADYKAVCLKRWQFSGWMLAGGAANYDATMAAARSLLDRMGRPSAVLRECVWVAEGIVLNVLQDRTRRADHYYSPSAMAPAGSEPSWAKGRKPVVEIGRHRFYRLTK